jgi:hypothetical protein
VRPSRHQHSLDTVIETSAPIKGAGLGKDVVLVTDGGAGDLSAIRDDH